MYISFKDIIKAQKKSLSYKIDNAKEAIEAGFSVCRSRAALAFSGGKDSTVLWHLMKTYFPEQSAGMAVIYNNTGVEFPESLKFAREMGNKWGGGNFYEARPERLKKDALKYDAQQQVLMHLVETGQINAVLKNDGKLKTTQALENACPPEMLARFYADGLIWKAGTLKSYWWCVDQYGYPVLGKAASKLKARRINIDCFLKFSETTTDKEELKKYYNILRKVKISQACCDVLKKEPSEKIQADLKIDVIYKGLMAAESHSRKVNFSTRGYLFKSSRKHLNTPFYHCNPLSIWTDNDIWEYIRINKVPYSSLYDITYKDTDGKEHKIKRNGCIGCFTDYGRRNNHMFVLRQTHPGLWRAVMKYGMAKEIQKLRVASKHSRPTLLDGMIDSAERYDEHISWAIENRPCSFD